MLSYQHEYHAGNIADILKHLALVLIIQYLQKKEKPCFFLDSHAGSGIYNLFSERAQKTGEIQEGIGTFWAIRRQLPQLFLPYVQAIEHYNNKSLQFYPGSFALMQHFLRSNDRLWGYELHPETYLSLKKLVSSNNSHVENLDGYQQIIASVPPTERRGLLLIDPSFEIKTEYDIVAEVINEAVRRFATGVYCLWYPILSAQMHEKLLRSLARLPVKEVCHIELFWQKSVMRMQGSGLWIINPPYTFKTEMQMGLEAMKRVFPDLHLSFKLTTSAKD